MADAKAQAIAVAAQLADMETKIGQICGMVMQAAIHNQPGAADTASGVAYDLRSDVSALDALLDQFIDQLRK